MWWLPSLSWTIGILVLSSDLGSFSNTSSRFQEIVLYFLPHLEVSELYVYQLVLRKSAHIVAYGLLFAWVIMALCRSSRPWRSSTGAQMVTAVVYCLVVACLDETHQLYVCSRTGSIYDVGWDGLGVGTMLVVMKYLKSN